MNRRDIIKAIAATPLVALLGKKQEASATSYTVPTNRIFGITGSMWENHYWTGPNGESMKVEMLARTRDSYDYFFAVYPPDFKFAFYRRFSIHSELVGLDAGRAQHEYELFVGQALDHYFRGIGVEEDQDLGLEPMSLNAYNAKNYIQQHYGVRA